MDGHGHGLVASATIKSAVGLEVTNLIRSEKNIVELASLHLGVQIEILDPKAMRDVVGSDVEFVDNALVQRDFRRLVGELFRVNLNDLRRSVSCARSGCEG